MQIKNHGKACNNCLKMFFNDRVIADNQMRLWNNFNYYVKVKSVSSKKSQSRFFTIRTRFALSFFYFCVSKGIGVTNSKNA